MTRWFSSLDTRENAGRVGLGLAGITAVVSGISVFVNASAVRAVGDPVLFTTLKNGVAAVLLLGIAMVAVRGPWRPQWRAAPGLLALGVIGGSLPFVLFFSGLAQATAPAAAVIHKTLFVWVALLAVVFLRERLGGLQIGALGVLLVSQLLVQSPTGVGWGIGEMMIAAATAFWALEVIVAKRVLGGVPSPVAAAARMGIGLVVLIGFLGATGGSAAIGSLRLDQVGWVLLTGLLLTAYVASWYAALQRAPASAVTAVLTIGAPITAGLQLVAAGQVPTPSTAAGYGIGLVAAVVVAAIAIRGRRPTPVPQPARS
ncbi:MAG TPA: DMT family transporter [Candidatus Limnocylindria bacterium]|jgi:drug/metabolite transporter (DMT)-like permease